MVAVNILNTNFFQQIGVLYVKCGKSKYNICNQKLYASTYVGIFCLKFGKHFIGEVLSILNKKKVRNPQRTQVPKVNQKLRSDSSDIMSYLKFTKKKLCFLNILLKVREKMIEHQKNRFAVMHSTVYYIINGYECVKRKF